MIHFIHNYTEENRIHLPGRIPGLKKTDIQLLPTHITKKALWSQYCQAVAALSPAQPMRQASNDLAGASSKHLASSPGSLHGFTGNTGGRAVRKKESLVQTVRACVNNLWNVGDWILIVYICYT